MSQAVETLTPPSAADLAEDIKSTWAAHVLREQSAPSKTNYIYASRYSPCLRRMVYEMTHGDQQVPFDADTIAKFRRGNDRERDLVSDLAKVGRDCDYPFDIVSQQERFELRDRKGRVAIVGRVDARLRYRWGAGYPVEVKSWSVFLTEGIREFDDLFLNRWTLRGAYQLLMYLLGAGEPLGFILLDRSGLPDLIPVELNDKNLSRAETFLSRAEKALDHKDAGTLPDFISDTEECHMCPFFGSVCQPPLKYSPVEIISDPEGEQILERWSELRDGALEYNRLDKQLKARFRPRAKIPVKTLLGRFLLRGSWGKLTKYEIPVEIKEQYKTVDAEGVFRLRVEKI